MNVTGTVGVLADTANLTLTVSSEAPGFTFKSYLPIVLK